MIHCLKIGFKCLKKLQITSPTFIKEATKVNKFLQTEKINEQNLGTARYLKESSLFSGKKGGFIDGERLRNSDFKQGPSLLLKDLTGTQVIEYRNEESVEQSKITQREEVNFFFVIN